MSCRDCEEEAGPAMAGTLKDGVWNSLLNTKKILINEEITDTLIERAVMQIIGINEYDDIQEATYVKYERTPIKIYINTNGGMLDEAFSLISAIDASRTPVQTIALGKAWSAGFLILLAGHHRACQKYSSLMYHQGSAGINDNFGKMIEYATHWGKTQDRVEEYVAERTKVKAKKLRHIFHHKTDWYVTPKQALKHGIVDDILGVTDQEEETTED